MVCLFFFFLGGGRVEIATQTNEIPGRTKIMTKNTKQKVKENKTKQKQQEPQQATIVAN